MNNPGIGSAFDDFLEEEGVREEVEGTAQRRVLAWQTEALVQELESAALSLPRAEKARLAERLLASLDEDPDVDAAWRDEVRRRLAVYRAGEMESIPADEALKQARKRLER
ncbi:MAG: addiction module protein [Gemmatimonadota bacterium]|jgi:putative addiction module component (TIGR02574 family)